MADSGEMESGGGDRSLSPSYPERIEKIQYKLFVLSIFKLRYDAKYQSIPLNFACLHKYI